MTFDSSTPQWLDGQHLISQGTTLGPQFILRLQVHPEFLGCPEVPGQPNRSICGDSALALHNLVDPTRQYADRHGDLVLGDSETLDEVHHKDLAWANGLDQVANGGRQTTD